MSLRGADGEGRATVTIAAGPFDVRTTQSGLSQETIEDLQIFSLLSTAIVRGMLGGPVSIRRPASDPPDLLLTVRGTDYPVELTSLTLPAARSRLSEIRRVGRALSSRLTEGANGLTHLRGTVVFVADMAGDSDRLPRVRDLPALVDSMVRSLTPEVGVVGDTPFPDNADGTMADFIPASIAQRGRVFVEGYWLEVHSTNQPDSVPYATANVQARVVVNELQASVREILARKDKPTNKTVIITSGLPDETGHSSSIDRHLYDLILHHGLGSSELVLDHVDTVLLHQWQTHELAVVYARDGVRRPFELPPRLPID